MATTAVLERYVEKTVSLSEDQVAKTLPFLEVIRVLNEAQVKYVLVGAHGIAGWLKKPRATEDVDIVVAAKQIKKAVTALTAAFPELEPVDLPVVVRLRDSTTQDVLIDVMKPLQQPYTEALKNSIKVTKEGQSFQVPSLEMAVLMKFCAMTSPLRAERDKHQDAHDFMYMIDNNPDLNTAKLGDLAAEIYHGADKMILEMVRRVRASEKLII